MFVKLDSCLICCIGRLPECSYRNVRRVFSDRHASRGSYPSRSLFLFVCSSVCLFEKRTWHLDVFGSSRQTHFLSGSRWTNWLPVFSHCQAAGLRCQAVRFVCLSVCLSVFVSVCWSNSLFVRPSVRPSVPVCIIFVKSVSIVFALKIFFSNSLSLSDTHTDSSKPKSQSTLMTASQSSTVKPVTRSSSTSTQQALKPPVAQTKAPGRGKPNSMTFPADGLIVCTYPHPALLALIELGVTRHVAGIFQHSLICAAA